MTSCLLVDRLYKERENDRPNLVLTVVFACRVTTRLFGFDKLSAPEHKRFHDVEDIKIDIVAAQGCKKGPRERDPFFQCTEKDRR
jgi:hypothetical protein